MPDPFDKPLSLDTLGDLDDGTVRQIVDRALREALDDCDARPMLEKARKVAATITFEPILDQATGALKGVATNVQVKTTIPPQQGNGDYLRTNIRGDHVTAYLPDSHQDTMFARNEEAS